ncbi:hypothetical protein QQF64_006330 [Cirrhinus molitorella]|uniref:Uncharacterized protein n=1 Tax=Cirrhinus molitorella TaxID=172907 RepID=A0ABR3MGX9_9TELE
MPLSVPSKVNRNLMPDEDDFFSSVKTVPSRAASELDGYLACATEEMGLLHLLPVDCSPKNENSLRPLLLHGRSTLRLYLGSSFPLPYGFSGIPRPCLVLGLPAPSVPPAQPIPSGFRFSQIASHINKTAFFHQTM